MARCDSYAAGFCTWGACELAPWLPEGWGDAKDWALNAMIGGFGVTQEATLGAIVVYGSGFGYSDLGHVGVVTAVYGDGSFEVEEMNAVGLGVYDSRHSSLSDVIGFILPPGVQEGAGAPPGSVPGGSAYSGLAEVWSRLAGVLSSDLPGWAGNIASATAQIRSLRS